MEPVARRFAVTEKLPPPLDPDRFIVWLARQQRVLLIAGAAFAIPAMLPVALVPTFVGRAIDEGIAARNAEALITWSLAVFVVAIVAAASTTIRHNFAVRSYLAAMYRTNQVVEDAVRRIGPALTRKHSQGQVVSVFASDMNRMGALFEVSARFCAACVSFVVVAAILIHGSFLLGMIVLIGCPMLLGVLGFVVRPLQQRQLDQRAATGDLTSVGADTVAGLRVLRGIGGEQVFHRRYIEQSQNVRATGYRLATTQAFLDAGHVLLPGIFSAIVIGVGAHLALNGDITAGQLVAFYGYTAFLTIPLRTATEFVEKLVRTRVSARRVVESLSVPADHDSSSGSVPDESCQWSQVDFADNRSGVVVPAGKLTALVSIDPEETAQIARRLGRCLPGHSDVSLCNNASEAHHTSTVSLDDVPVAQVRGHVLVSEAEPHLFSGPLRQTLVSGATEADDVRIADALRVASAEEVLDSLDDGLDSVLTERGRSLSGGQRQRLSLTRVVLREPDVLVLIEPTSAVDAHTESRIASRLAAHRRGRTTVLVTASPLLLKYADTVHCVAGGQVVGSGSHRDLLTSCREYREVVLRGESLTEVDLVDAQPSAHAATLREA